MEFLKNNEIFHLDATYKISKNSSRNDRYKTTIFPYQFYVSSDETEIDYNLSLKKLNLIKCLADLCVSHEIIFELWLCLSWCCPCSLTI